MFCVFGGRGTVCECRQVSLAGVVGDGRYCYCVQIVVDIKSVCVCNDGSRKCSQ